MACLRSLLKQGLDLQRAVLGKATILWKERELYFQKYSESTCERLFTLASYPLTISVFSLLQPNIPVLFLQQEIEHHRFHISAHKHNHRRSLSVVQSGRQLQDFLRYFPFLLNSSLAVGWWAFSAWWVFNLQHLWSFGSAQIGSITKICTKLLLCLTHTIYWSFIIITMMVPTLWTFIKWEKGFNNNKTSKYNLCI